MEFTQLDQYLFGQGTHYEIYKKLGAHPTSVKRKKAFILQYGRLMQKVFLLSVNLIIGIQRQIPCKKQGR